jgi:hypothetical protein
VNASPYQDADGDSEATKSIDKYEIETILTFVASPGVDLWFLLTMGSIFRRKSVLPEMASKENHSLEVHSHRTI